MKEIHESNVELPDGSLVSIRGGDAATTAELICNHIREAKVTTTKRHARQAPRAQAAPSALVTNVPPHLQELLGVNGASRGGYVSNVEALALPSMMGEQKQSVHPAGLAHGPSVNQNVEAEDDADEKEYHRTLRNISGPVFNESVEALEIPTMKFDQPSFMKREHADDEPTVTPLETPEPILAS